MSADVVVAAVKVGPGRTELRELPRPSVAADAGLLRIEAAGICGSDVRSYARPARHGEAHVMGHENVGRVVAIGAEAARRWGVREGDRVVLEEYLPCGDCDMCRAGEHRFCEQTNIHAGRGAIRYGTTPLSVAPGLWGGFSEMLYMHPSSIVHPLDTRTPARLAALALPIANGLQWVHVDGGAAPGQTVLIFGPGQQGLGCVIGAREAGVDKIIVAGTKRSATRLAAARALGANHTVDVDAEDLVARVRALTDGRGVDVAVDTAAASDVTLRAALEAIKAKGGVILTAAGRMDQTIADFPIGIVKNKFATLKGVRGHGHDAVRRAIALIQSGRYALEVMATHRRGLDHVDEALRLGAEGGDAIHISIVPGASA